MTTAAPAGQPAEGPLPAGRRAPQWQTVIKDEQRRGGVRRRVHAHRLRPARAQ
jgi:hypothetical protein